jgi:hypothetical protein
MRHGSCILVTVLLAVGVYFGCRYYQRQSDYRLYVPKAIQLFQDMRKLWEDHIVWTRNYVISALSNLDDINSVAQRLLQNQVDIGNAITPVYGEKAGTKLSALLKDHIMIATEVVKAAKESNNVELDKSSKKWHDNADEIAHFLSSANPHWPENVLKDMLYKHLEYTTGEVVSRLKKDWKSDIEFYDKNHMHMIMMSDALSAGIIRQFPEQFK